MLTTLAAVIVAGAGSLVYMTLDRLSAKVAEHEERMREMSDASEMRIGGFDGMTESSDMDVESGQKNVRLLELPATRKGELIISHLAYTLSYNTMHNNPNWVAWELTAQETEGTGQRSKEFLPDPLLEERYQVTTWDYKGSGYDRGHMCPAADNKWNSRAMTECFYMSNVCPQLHELNAGGWESLESACRRWAKQEGSILIVCGPVYDKEVKTRQGKCSTRKQQTIGAEHHVTVPTGFFKCVMSLRKGQEKAIGFYYANTNAKQTMNDACMTVDEIESLTGYDFFVNVPKRLEQRIEATCSLTDWR